MQVTQKVIDYVTFTVTVSRQAQDSNAYTDFRVFVGAGKWVQKTCHATMGAVVIIGNNDIVKMNGDLRDGSKLIQNLALLP